jgi:hypothetical protein
LQGTFSFRRAVKARFREREGANHPDPGTQPADSRGPGVVVTSAWSEERMALLQGIDEATDRIDGRLTDLISHPKSRDARHAVLSNAASRAKDGDPGKRLADQVPKDSS